MSNPNLEIFAKKEFRATKEDRYNHFRADSELLQAYCTGSLEK